MLLSGKNGGCRMLKLNEKIRNYIERSDLTQYKLAKRARIDPPTFNKMMNGTRQMSSEYLEKICSVLCLTQSEHEELVELKEREKVGDIVYEQRQNVRKLIENTAILNNAEVLDSNTSIAFVQPIHQYVSEPVAVNGTYAVNTMLSQLLESEFYGSEKLNVSMFSPADYGYLSSVLFGLSCVDVKKIFVRHILRLESRSGYGPLNNLDLMSGLIPYIISGRNCCRMYYYYGSGNEKDEVASPFPFYLIINDKLVLLSANLSNALYIPTPAIVETYRQTFEHAVSKTKEIVTVFDSPFSFIDQLNDVDKNTKTDERFYFVSSPMSCLVLPAEKILGLRRKEVPGIEEIAAMLMERYKYLHENKIVDTYRQVFSLESLDRFIQTGYSDEYPITLVHEYPLEARLELIEGYIQFIKNGGNCVAADPARFRIPSDCTINCVPGQYVNFFVTNRDWSQHCSMLIEEESIVSAFEEFVAYLPSSKLVLTPEETIAELEIRCARLKVMIAAQEARNS